MKTQTHSFFLPFASFLPVKFQILVVLMGDMELMNFVDEGAFARNKV